MCFRCWLRQCLETMKSNLQLDAPRGILPLVTKFRTASCSPDPRNRKPASVYAVQSEKHINQKACLHFHIMSQQSLGTFLLTINSPRAGRVNVPTLQKVNIMIAQVMPKVYSLRTGWLLYVSLAFVDCMLQEVQLFQCFLSTHVFCIPRG